MRDHGGLNYESGFEEKLTDLRETVDLIFGGEENRGVTGDIPVSASGNELELLQRDRSSKEDQINRCVWKGEIMSVNLSILSLKRLSNI